MERNEIIKKLISIYEEAYSVASVQPNLEEMNEVCYAYGVQQGVCTAMARNCCSSSEEMRDNWLLMADTIHSYSDEGSPFWGETPQYAKFKHELLSYLDYRLNILYEIKQSQ